MPPSYLLDNLSCMNKKGESPDCECGSRCGSAKHGASGFYRVR